MRRIRRIAGGLIFLTITGTVFYFTWPIFAVLLGVMAVCALLIVSCWMMSNED